MLLQLPLCPNVPLHGFLRDFKGNSPHNDLAEAQAADTVNPFCMLISPSIAFASFRWGVGG